MEEALKHWETAVFILVVLIGNNVVNWWLRLKDQKSKDIVQSSGLKSQIRMDRETEFNFIIAKYRDLLLQRESSLAEVQAQLVILTKEHQACATLMVEYKTRLEFAEKTILASGKDRDELHKTMNGLQAKLLELERK